jgi:DNA-binding response OmpR family regulator
MSGAMIVSVDKELIKFVKAALREIGMSLTGEYGSSKDALEAYKDASTDLVILDTFLPATSGMEVMANLKRMNEQGSFLLLSRLRTRMALEKSFRLGAQDVLLYPVAADVLRDTIQRRQAQQAQQEAEDQKAAAAALQAQQALNAKPPRS